jgi:hypothetical protein
MATAGSSSNYGTFERAEDVALQPNGKIVIVGQAYDTTPQA